MSFANEVRDYPYGVNGIDTSKEIRVTARSTLARVLCWPYAHSGNGC